MSKDGKKLYTHQRFVSMALDPVHIGTGGYRLGRVDNTIVREPGTNLPKIPGTSLLGAARSYAAMRYGKPEAAGQHKKLTNDQKKNCPIIYTFGTYAETGGGQAGKVSIGDAHILFFPVYSMAGPMWVSTKEVIECAGFGSNGVNDIGDETVHTSLNLTKDRLNLGWLLLKAETGLSITLPDPGSSKEEWPAIFSRIALVSPKLFSQIVNSNLEVRTSVAINPETGAAEDKALFTYEAIPRATWLWFDVIDDNYSGAFPVTENQFKGGEENSGDSIGKKWDCPLDVVRTGLELVEYLGVGGMGTRGFGRIKPLADWEVE
ncbi:MAG: type III-B CRISPR module RAMP protein Cmr4 [Methanosarcinales archaeon]|nr:MAG: type III-B CRISPR module RAMP protein Cmr4 [Methanosarcinales archaeon]